MSRVVGAAARTDRIKPSILCQDLRDFLNRSPRTRRGGNPEDFFDPAEVADCFHFAPINAEHELVLDLLNLQKPIFFRWETERNRRRFVRWFVQHAGETSDLRTRRLPREWIFACKSDNRFCRNDHVLAFEGQLLRDRSAENGFARIFAHYERPNRANVNDAELFQLNSDLRGTAAIRSANVHSAKKDDRGH